MEGLLNGNGLRGMQKVRACRTLQRLFSVVAVLLNPSTRRERTAALKRAYVRFSETSSEVAGGKGQQA